MVEAAAPMLPSRHGRVVFGARRPTALVLPLAAVTELGGALCLLVGADIGWFICAAPVGALLVTGLLFRPTIELAREGIVQRQYPFSSLTRWEAVEHVELVRAGNRVVLAYRLRQGIPPPRRQPAAALLRAAGLPFDGGYFADSLAAGADELLAAVSCCLAQAAVREALAPRR